MTDVLCLGLSLFIASRFIGDAASLAFGSWWAVLSAPLIWLAVFRGLRLYETEHLSSWDELRRTISATTFGAFGIVMLSLWSTSTFSRTWFGLTWGLALLLELLTRRSWRRLVSRLRVSGVASLRTLIVGANGEAEDIGAQLEPPHLGFKPLGYMAVDSTPVTANHIPVLGRLEDVRSVIRQHEVDCLFVASTAVNATEMLKVAEAARREGVMVKVSANVPEMLTSRLTVQPIGNVMGLSLRPVSLTKSQMILKRMFDVTLATIGLVLTLPVTLVTALLIKLTSKGPVLFRQTRVAKDGHFFSILKFRTMVQGGDHLVDGLDLSSPFFKLEDDPRVTRVGRVIRKLSIDELPQLFNVVKGEMSLVGPRPLPTDQVVANIDTLAPRLEVPAGVTGWWQIQGRSNLGASDALRMDLFYIENWSLALDLYIVIKTIGALVARRGAH
ncbi:MAG TPA: sugar transferase [Actinomycetota bacterium]|nr:sugar transferase [Actinomycetota bacterium]